MNFTLPLVATITTKSLGSIANGDTCLKEKRRHWRSPSNPIDFKNCFVTAEAVEEITLLPHHNTHCTSNSSSKMLKVGTITVN